MLHSFSEYKEAVANIQKQKQFITLSMIPIDMDYIEALGINKEIFNVNFNKLNKIWRGLAAIIPESEGKMFVTSILANPLEDPVIAAIIADDLSCFIKQQKKRSDIYYLEFCCVCGAEKIIREIYLKDDKKQCLIDSEDAIAFAVSSGNSGLALDLARESKKLGKKTPGLLALYSAGNYKNIDAISATFSSSPTTILKPSI